MVNTFRQKKRSVWVALGYVEFAPENGQDTRVVTVVAGHRRLQCSSNSVEPWE